MYYCNAEGALFCSFNTASLLMDWSFNFVEVSHVIDWCGRKLGLIGLVEREWLDTLATINPEEVSQELTRDYVTR
jgi:hypothetical protein